MPFFDVLIGDNLVIGHIDESEIFRLSFNPQNFIENFHKSVPISVGDSGGTVRAMLRAVFPDITEEQIESEVESVSFEINKIIHEEKTRHVAARISENLHGLLIAIMEDAIHAYSLEGSVELHKQAGKPLSIGKFKKAILEKHWSRIRDLAGIKQGGARERKGFVWTKEMKLEFFTKVETLPKYQGKSVWQYILETLIEQEFDAETLRWLKTRPALEGIPEYLLNDAVKAWRKHLALETWNEMKEKEKPRAFEYRYALYLLNYPDKFAYSTLETYYYEGKKLSETQK